VTLQLPATHQAWLQARIADGTFTSPDDAIAQLIAERMALEVDDFDWAKADVENARADATAGQFITLEEHRARIARRLAGLQTG
jgi:predicted transcriptional regulator